MVAHTHHLPRRWRNKAHTRAVADEFGALFPFAAASLVEELVSVFVAPALLWFSLPRCAPAIVRFVREFTTHVEGVGHVCSMAAFDFARHGNSRYGSPVDASRAARSGQGKMEKSFLSFHALYPSGWEPDATGKAVLAALAAQQGRQSVWARAAATLAPHAAAWGGAVEGVDCAREQALLQSLWEERAAGAARTVPRNA